MSSHRMLLPLVGPSSSQLTHRDETFLKDHALAAPSYAAKFATAVITCNSKVGVGTGTVASVHWIYKMCTTIQAIVEQPHKAQGLIASIAIGKVHDWSPDHLKKYVEFAATICKLLQAPEAVALNIVLGSIGSVVSLELKAAIKQAINSRYDELALMNDRGYIDHAKMQVCRFLGYELDGLYGLLNVRTHTARLAKEALMLPFETSRDVLTKEPFVSTDVFNWDNPGRCFDQLRQTVAWLNQQTIKQTAGYSADDLDLEAGLAASRPNVTAVASLKADATLHGLREPQPNTRWMTRPFLDPRRSHVPPLQPDATVAIDLKVGVKPPAALTSEPATLGDQKAANKSETPKITLTVPEMMV
jgi:hypothetical protein